MATAKQRKAKIDALVARWKEINETAGIELMAGMWDDQMLDILILILGVGSVKLYDS